VEESADGFRILLDGKPVRTPARRPLSTPARALAEAIAAEWQTQTDMVDPAKMPRTRLANSIIDGVADSKDAVAQEIVKYLGSDLLFYRAGEPAGLVARQAEHWDPVVAWARDTLGARFILAEGVVHVAQPPEAIEAVRAAVPDDPWRLGALHVVTTLTGSALLALALSRGALSRDAAWEAAHVDEDWQMTQWGRDTLALARRAFRFAEMEAAAEVLTILGK
jgi:chaperone required for assembly of F1-ATPase